MSFFTIGLSEILSINEGQRHKLFYRDALRQIAGLVDVAPASDSDIAGEQLQRHARCNGAEAIAHLRNISRGRHASCISSSPSVAIATTRGAAGLGIPEYWKSPCRTWGSSWQPRSQGKPLVEQRDGPVLHFARPHRPRHADRKFPPEFQRALVANGGANATANEQGILRIFACERRFFDSARVGQDLFNAVRYRPSRGTACEFEPS